MTHRGRWKFNRWFVVIAFVVGLTPSPDVVSQMMMDAPMIVMTPARGRDDPSWRAGGPAYRRGMSQVWLSDYESQTNMLRTVTDDPGSLEGAFTAKAVTVQNTESGHVFTMATLTETVDTLRA